jgi:glutamyl-tRNA reductase
LAADLDAGVLSWEWRERMLAEVDAVVCGTGAQEPVLTAAALERASEARHGRRLVVVDLAVPANVQRPARSLPGITLIDMEELSRRLAAERDRRSEAVRAAEVLVESAVVDWTAWILSRETAEPVRGGLCRARRGKAAG